MFSILISGEGIGNELCDLMILLLVLMIPINQYTLDRKRQNNNNNNNNNYLNSAYPVLF